MAKLVTYPAVLDDTDNPQGCFTVTFPDLPGAISEGKGLNEAVANGSEALGLYLCEAQRLPKASALSKVQKDNPGKVVVLISSDLTQARTNLKRL